MMKDTLIVSSSPHIRHIDTTSGIMLDVIISLVPALIYGIFIFGFSAAAVVCTCVLSAVVFEYLWNLVLKKPQSVGDFSAIVTGLILGLNLPPKTPIYIAAIGSFVAIVVVKQMFGGLGFNFVNPAIGARIVLLVSFPTAMASAASFLEPISKATVDTVSSATPLMLYGKEVAPSIKDLFFGISSGSIGETSAFLLLIGGIYLVLRRVISPITPVAFIGTVAVLTLISTGDINETLYFVFSGGLFLGAIFMATDYVTSPPSGIGKLIFGIGCGFLTFVIRKWGSLPEGVSYSIILMNILSPQIEKINLKKPFGLKEAAKNE